jgi:hypothetical protein
MRLLAYLSHGSSQLRTSLVRWALIIVALTAYGQEPPTKAYIEHHDWKIVWALQVPLGNDYDGQTDCAGRTIFVVHHLDDGFLDAETLQHEIIHALTCEDGQVHNLKLNSTSEEKHEGIYFLAAKLVEFARKNPKVMRFFQFAPDEKLRCCSIPYDATRAITVPLR